MDSIQKYGILQTPALSLTLSGVLINRMKPNFLRSPCKIAFSPNLCVTRKIVSSEYQIYVPQGLFLRGICGKIFHVPRSLTGSLT